MAFDDRGQPRGGPGPAEKAGLAIAAVWLIGSSVLVLTGGGRETASGFASVLMFVVLPTAVICLGVLAARTARIMRDEGRRLRVAIDALRTLIAEERQASGAGGVSQSVEKKLDEIARSARASEAALATFTSARAAAARAAPRPPAAGGNAAQGEDQPALALGTPAEALSPPPPRADLIRALNFPDTEDDEIGFAALRRALRDRQTKQLILSAQDVLTLLSHDGIYMDDLTPDRARPEVWRRFAKGERGRAVAALGGIRDRSSLALTAGRMREDAIFRDAVHHFLRKFDRMLTDFEPEATDEDIVALADTRTARAFMLLGRVTGTFD